MAKQIADENGVDPRRSASILDIFLMCMAGIIPYGGQLLLAGQLSQLSTIEIMPSLYYPYLLAIVAILAIIFGFPKAKA